MATELKLLETHFNILTRSPLMPFPAKRTKLDAPKELGVYVIYDPKGKVVHVGRTPSAEDGLYQRLQNHLDGKSSFTKKYLKGESSLLRNGYGFRYVAIPDQRIRALLEAYAIGNLCPAHIGLG